MNEHRLAQPSGEGSVFYLHPQHSDSIAAVADGNMSLDDKRALLANWASDARAVRDYPALRQLDTGAVVDIDAILSALKRLDDIQSDQTAFGIGAADSKHLGESDDGDRRYLRNFSDDDDDDPPPCPAAAVPWKPRPILDATGLLVA